MGNPQQLDGMENPLKMDALEASPFMETLIQFSDVFCKCLLASEGVYRSYDFFFG